MKAKKVGDIIETISERTMYKEEDIKEIVNMVFPIMLEMLLNGDDIMVKRFGRFTFKKKPPRVCVDARTGKKTMSNYKVEIKFRQSRKLADKLAILTNPEYDWGDETE